jgi:hypothetical protein
MKAKKTSTETIMRKEWRENLLTNTCDSGVARFQDNKQRNIAEG